MAVSRSTRPPAKRAEPAPERPDQPLTVALAWIERHCIVPDGWKQGAPFRLYNYQFRYLLNFYMVRGSAEWIPEAPIFAPSFVYRRGLLVGPQKLGKNPMIATQVCLEGVGPSCFGGWAGTDEGYVCRDFGCRCGWEFPYAEGEPKGFPRPTPLIQITAYSQEATDNTYKALRLMVDNGPLHDQIPHTGEEFIRLPGNGEIVAVTSSALSRLGNPVTFAPQDEVGVYTKRNGMTTVADTQYRGLAGMSGRASLTSNAWDPSEKSTGQLQFESKVDDVYRQFTMPPARLSYRNKAERHKIHRIVYEPDTLRENGGHVDLDSIEAEAHDLIQRDEAQAARFFGNKLVTGAGKAFDSEVFLQLAAPKHKVRRETGITIGGDGSRIRDHFSLIATVIETGYQWPLGIWRPTPQDPVPMGKVQAVLEEAVRKFDVVRMYFDPPYIESWVSKWVGLFGKERCFEWYTGRPKSMAYAIRSWHGAINRGELSHCPREHEFCALFVEHVGNAYKDATGYRDEETNEELWLVKKETPMSGNKIDSVPAAVLSWEARADALAEGYLQQDSGSTYDTYKDLTI